MPPALQPTPWRTCRVLANRSRLRLLKLLIEQPDQCVSELARQCGLRLAAASQYLRALNARGLLQVNRNGRWVRYRPADADAPEPIRRLLQALRGSFGHDRDPVERIFRLATSFTHPRRVEIWRALQRGAQTGEQLQGMTRMSRHALSRHLVKLRSRGLVTTMEGRYRALQPRQALVRAFANLARGT
jgi:DNA-binding transcriptional ArsR family regulator